MQLVLNYFNINGAFRLKILKEEEEEVSGVYLLVDTNVSLYVFIAPGS